MQHTPGYTIADIWNLFYTKLFVIVCGLGILPLLFFEKWTIVLFINKYIPSHRLDSFFMYYTDTALGGTYVLLAIIVIFFSYRKAAMIAISGILILIVSMICKHLLFGGFDRPTAEIPNEQLHHIIEGFRYARHNSFPSGHTMSAFGLATIFSFFSSKKYVHIALLIYAISIAFSRMYLLQRFYVDVFVGAIIGYSIAITVILFQKAFHKIPQFGILTK